MNLHASPLRAEFGPPGEFIQGPRGRWFFLPAPLPPQLDLAYLVSRLARTQQALEHAGRRNVPASAAVEGSAPPDENTTLFERAQALRHSHISLQSWLCALHGILGEHGKIPEPIGELRAQHVSIKSQADFGGVLLKAPPARLLPGILAALEDFTNSRSALHPILTAILVQYQIVAAHPFIDGNGRLGCLVLELMLARAGWSLPKPLSVRRVARRHKRQLIIAIRDVIRWGQWTGYLEFWFRVLEDVSRESIT